MRLIDADKLELDAEWSEYEDGYISYSQIQIDTAPTIDIVHCKDCKWSESNGSNTDGYFCHHGHHNPLYQVFSLHFCSYGERIDNE